MFLTLIKSYRHSVVRYVKNQVSDQHCAPNRRFASRGPARRRSGASNIRPSA